MQLIGLTGGIATGKSTVAKLFAERGIAVIDVDSIARPIVDAQRAYIQQYCPEAIVDGKIDRKALAVKLFESKSFRHGLNERVHPRVVFRIILLLVYYYITFHKRVVIDVPLLFESGFDTWMSVNLVVSCDEEEEIQRLMRRDSIDKDEAERRINVQIRLQDKCELADHVIDNNGSVEGLRPQVDKFLAKFELSIILNLVYWSPIPIIVLLSTTYLFKVALNL